MSSDNCPTSTKDPTGIILGIHRSIKSVFRREDKGGSHEVRAESFYGENSPGELVPENAGIDGFVRSIKEKSLTGPIELIPGDGDRIAPPSGSDISGEGKVEIERYSVREPFTFIKITYDNGLKEYEYHVCEPELTGLEVELLERLYDDLRDILIRGEPAQSDVDRNSILRSKCDMLISIYGIDLPGRSRQKILYYLERNYLGYGCIDALMHDGQIEDISCNGVNVPIFLFHKKYQNIKTNIKISKEDELNSLVMRLVQRGGRHISVANPIANATLPDGSRIEATLGREVTTRGSSFTIRKFRPDPFTPVDMLKFKTMSSEMLSYFWLAIENNKNLLFAGGTASGKTSSLNAVSLFVPQGAKVITIEDTRELTLYHNNWIAGLTRDAPAIGVPGEISMYELLKAALRQRPEYIIVGEVRGKEALTLFQAMNTGHTTYSTMHAGSIQAVVNRLLNEPINVPNMMLQSLNIVSIQELTYNEGVRARRTKSVVEITGVDVKTNNLRINELFRWDSANDTYERLAESYVINDIMAKRGWDRARIDREINNRIKVLDHLQKENIRDYRSFSIVTHLYSVMPEQVLELIDRGELRDLIRPEV
ncbi:secretion system protein E [Methanocella sp. CWC-04]|uniref:Secretion system protein E n=1 Tax=Methanooceanicella nereidis TaxID=2052831 RepID=A0AAP2REW2_9EURY|nr:type II/IV secretion system ATPase subunit [Methanocella sp. CWC-04]MCD1296063.1 secretion system protein E [Methanocella sp. CWC-04]